MMNRVLDGQVSIATLRDMRAVFRVRRMMRTFAQNVVGRRLETSASCAMSSITVTNEKSSASMVLIFLTVGPANVYLETWTMY